MMDLSSLCISCKVDLMHLDDICIYIICAHVYIYRDAYMNSTLSCECTRLLRMFYIKIYRYIINCTINTFFSRITTGLIMNVSIDGSVSYFGEVLSKVNLFLLLFLKNLFFWKVSVGFLLRGLKIEVM